MTWLLIPAADRAKARTVVSRMDAVLGYPRTLAESEITRIGPVSQTIPAPRCETQTAVMLHDATGAAALHGAIAIQVDDVVQSLRERPVDIDGTRKLIREWIADQAWQTQPTLPGVLAAWANVTPRDGGTGSADGRPIPESEDAARLAAPMTR